MSVISSVEYKKEIDRIARDIPQMDCTVLITGAAGMIGSAIMDAIILSNVQYENNIRIVALERNADRVKSRFSYAEQWNFITFLIQSVEDELQTEEQIDYIIHTASNADPVAYSLYPAETMITNILGTKNMLDYCKIHPEARLLMTSTFEVYGKKDGQDIYREDDSGEISLNEVRSCYPESKRCSEILMRSYKKEYGTDCVIARLCSIYGPTMAPNDSKAHAQFLRNGINGQDIVLKSEGTQKRTYCYLMDAVSALLAVLFRGVSGEAYNICNEDAVASIADVANTVARLCGTKVVYDLPDEIERTGFSRPQNCILDNAKLRGLGWKGAYNLEKGLGATLMIMREQ